MIESYSDLIREADRQAELQRLLFVFCRAELPDDASPEETERFEKGEGGALSPVICVDKPLEEVRRFSVLVSEARETRQHWDVVFVAALSGRGGQPPSTDEAQQPLTMMVESIRLGKVSEYLPFTRDGDLLAIG